MRKPASICTTMQPMRQDGNLLADQCIIERRAATEAIKAYMDCGKQLHGGRPGRARRSDETTTRRPSVFR